MLRVGFGDGFGEEIDVRPGDHIVIPRGVGHSETVPSDEPASMIVASAGPFETHPA